MPQSPAYRPNVAAQDFARCQRGVAAPVVAIPGVGDDLVHPSRVAEAQRAVQFAAQGNTQRSLERSQVPPIPTAVIQLVAEVQAELAPAVRFGDSHLQWRQRSEGHTSELQSLM